uniref:Putative cytochrome P450 monooxygenase CYP88D7 n=1 Tax=Astragalus sinicus TaxID=47065 RepID=N0DMA3_ASTSI|nr:putative cytochrome P450 monooxygenase CYP88D7 [Astragalus sinicus]
MDLEWFWVSAATLLALYIFVNKVVRNLNGWYYDLKFRNKEYPLPPGDMGWPLIGNLFSFYKHFSSGHPDSFINNFVLRYGGTSIYKTHLYGSPSIIVCAPDMCKKVLTDDRIFKLGYPAAALELAKNRIMGGEDHRRFKRLVTAPISGQNALAMYLETIEDIVINLLEEVSSMKEPVELLVEMKKISFKVIFHIFVGSCDKGIIRKFVDLFDLVFVGMFSLPIKAPGFAYNKAIKARKELAKLIQYLIDERKLMIKNGQRSEKKYLLDILLEIDYENGKGVEDEDITNFFINILLAGHESTATGMMWSIIYLTQNPHLLNKAKEEQEEIMKARPSTQNRLSIMEIKQMGYLSKVINEMLRRTNIAFAGFREAMSDMNINGYFIPKGWKVLVWLRAIHMDPNNHANPNDFNPSRWDDYNATAGTFLPFGSGSWLCPGNDLAKFEMTIFLHYFLLNYKLEQINPDCPITNLPGVKPVDECLAKVIKVSNA